MDVTEQLQAYITQIVALGQATLAHRRRGEWLPDELAVQAAALLALESEMGATLAAAAPDEPVAAPDEPVAAPGVTAILDEADAPLRPAQPDEWPFVAAAPPELAAAPDESSAVAAGVAVMSPIEADNWLSALDEELSSELLILDGSDTVADDEPLVIDVDEGAGGGPATTGASTALPPLVIDPIHDLSTDSGAFPLPATATAQAPASAPDEPPPAELGFCTNCGATLRSGRRFCHRCGASVAEMAAAPPVSPADAVLPLPVATVPREEWPTIVSDPPRYVVGNAPAVPAAPEMARFCNNCGLGLGADVTVCPDCGSQDIS